MYICEYLKRKKFNTLINYVCIIYHCFILSVVVYRTIIVSLVYMIYISRNVLVKNLIRMDLRTLFNNFCRSIRKTCCCCKK